MDRPTHHFSLSHEWPWRWLTSSFLILVVNAAHAVGIEGFDENFDGVGSFETVDGSFSGMDSPGWSVETIGGRFTETGLRFSEPGRQDDISTMSRSVLGDGSFVHRVEIIDFAIEPVPLLAPPGSIALVRLTHDLDLDSQGLSISAQVAQYSEEEYIFNRAFADLLRVPVGTNIAIEIRYNAETMMTTHGYDYDILDDVPMQYFDPVNTEAFGDGNYISNSNHWRIALGRHLWYVAELDLDSVANANWGL